MDVSEALVELPPSGSDLFLRGVEVLPNRLANGLTSLLQVRLLLLLFDVDESEVEEVEGAEEFIVHDQEPMAVVITKGQI